MIGILYYRYIRTRVVLGIWSGALAIFINGPQVLPAQAPAPLSPDSPVVMEHIIHLNSWLKSEAAKIAISEPASTASLHRGIVSRFGVSESGYTTLDAVLSKAQSDLDQLRIDQDHYIAGLGTSAPSDTRLKEFDVKRSMILNKAASALATQLNASDWQAWRGSLADLAKKIKTGSASYANHR